MDQPQFKLVQPEQLELEAFQKEMEIVLNKYSFVLRAQPITKLIPNTGFILDAEVIALKKVELVPKEGVPSPFTENGGNNNAKTEEKGETPEAK